MDNSESWVSHTPETRPQEEQDEDFASATAECYSYQRPPSPPNTFEKFFLPFEATGVDTSTFALAGKSINNTTTATSRKFFSSHSSSILRSESIITDDFASATEDFSLTSDLDDISLEDTPQKSPIYNDILGQQTILEETPEEEHFNFDMAKRSKRTKNSMSSKPTITEPTPTPAPAVVEKEITPESESEPVPPTPEPETPVEETPKFDVVEHVYEGAKSAWAFGKGIIVFKPFMGVAEGAATKVLSITTGISTLEDADKQIKCTLAGVDKEFIDPAILKLWSALEPVIGKGDEVLKTVLGFVTTKVPLLKAKEEVVTETPSPAVEVKKQSDEVVAPEITTPAVVA
mmetsp:Transcript_4068/g.5906  ORF Transcript_4068/g.5906 Transcript_4068/m.5906 type:complete len:346 (+) Transcript_4068:357-1394(+)